LFIERRTMTTKAKATPVTPATPAVETEDAECAALQEAIEEDRGKLDIWIGNTVIEVEDGQVVKLVDRGTGLCYAHFMPLNGILRTRLFDICDDDVCDECRNKL